MALAGTQAATLATGTAPCWPRYDPDARRKLDAAQALHRPLDVHDPQVVRHAAALLTSQLFFAPLLAEMRKLPFGREVGYGGRTEEAFGEQLDQRIADAVARADGSLTAQLARRLERGARAAADPRWQRAARPTAGQPSRISEGSLA